MGVVSGLLNKVCLLIAEFSDAENYSMRLVCCRYKSGRLMRISDSEVADFDDIKLKGSAQPVILVLTGYGVLSKDMVSASGITEKVVAVDSGFVFSLDGQIVTFVRGEQIRPVIAGLRTVKAKVLTKLCIAVGEDNITETAERMAADFYRESMTMRNIIRPSGCVTAELLARKLRLPVLGVVLMLLTINTVVSDTVRDNFQKTHEPLETRRSAMGRMGDASRRKSQVATDFSQSLPCSVAFICDRIALALPRGITLISLSVQPPQKQPEDKKQVLFVRDRVIVCGEAGNSDLVYDYVTGLQRLGVCSSVRLSSIDRSRETGRTVFNIEISL